MRISLFATCIADSLFGSVPRSVVEVLERLGHEVQFDDRQTCCGQMHVNTGYAREALPLVRRFVRIFHDAEAVVTPSASCAALVCDHYVRLAHDNGDDALADDAKAVAAKVFEFSELLVHELGVEDVGAYFPRSVTYHPTCHSLRHLRVGDAPIRLLQAVRGLELIELPRAEQCCGFGGTFAVKQPDVSSAMLSDKVCDIRATRAEVCVAVDSSCLMQIAGALHRARAGMRTMHLAEVLNSGVGQ